MHYEHDWTGQNIITSVRWLLLLVVLLPASPTGAAESRLVLDYEADPAFEAEHSLLAKGAIEIDGIVYFSVWDSEHGREIWATDGTPEGTSLVADLCPGPCDTHEEPFNSPELVKFQGKLFFASSADQAIIGTWRFDGPGQRPVKIAPFSTDLTPLDSHLLFLRSGILWSTDGTVEGSQPLDTPRIEKMVRAGNQLFMSDVEDNLWRTDGTPEGTRRLLTSRISPNRLLALGNKALATSSDGLWLTDGTMNGTVRLFDSGESEALVPLAVAGDRAILEYFNNPAGLHELWSTDGTADGTMFVAPWPACCSTSRERFETADTFFMTLELFPPGPLQLWATDGTAAGTFQLAAFEDEFSSESVPFAATADHLFFAPFISGSGTSLWASDGTPNGTRNLQTPGSVIEIFAADDSAYFWTIDPSTSNLGQSDGTPEGTRILETSSRADCGGGLRGPWGAFDGRLYFSGCDEYGRQPWVSDGTPASGRRLTIIENRDGLRPKVLSSNSRFVFFAGPHSTLWRSDGTEAGTLELAEGQIFSPPKIVAQLGDDLLLTSGPRIWRTDGTAAGTESLYEASRSFSSQRFSVLLEGIAYFLEDSILWRSDATSDGTFPIAELRTHPLSGLHTAVDPSATTRLVFGAGGSSIGLWSSDGSFDGTRLIPLPTDLHSDLMPLGSQLYFEIDTSPPQLWRTDGTEAGTALAFDHSAVFDDDVELWMVGTTHLYAVVDGARGLGLWRSDGTAAGTARIADLPSMPFEDFYDPIRIYPPVHVAVGSAIYFAVDDNDFGVELWRADASGAGRVADIWPGSQGSFPTNARAADGLLYFAASDGLNGVEPWVTDGTAAGTVRIADIAPGSRSSNPSGFTELGDEIFFRANDGLHGPELWAVTAEPPCPDPNACLSDARFRVSVRWRDQHAGGTEGLGSPVSFSDDSALFWFFDADNIELVVKILDGRSINGHFWFFSGALSDVEYWIDVLDTTTGETRTFYNPPGNLCGLSDIEALPANDSATGDSAASDSADLSKLPTAVQPPRGTAVKGANCGGGENALCLRDDRFRVEVEWKNQHAGGVEGDGMPIAGTDESGYFWFFDDGSIDLIVKILDGRPLNGNFWVFYGALSDVEYQITVTDTVTGAQAIYDNPPGELCGQGDINAL